jgi:hypothetical protein
MSDFEHELLDLLEKDGKFDPAREEVLRLQVTSEFSRKKKRLLIWTWVWQAVCAAILIPGLFMAFGQNDLRTTIQGVGVIVMGEAGLIVIKLWYWIVHGRLEVMRELKRLELRWTLERADAQRCD